jgi:membrane-bound lytic murein transglycosylase A
VLSLAPFAAHGARRTHISHNVRPHLPYSRPVPYPRLVWPLEISGSQYMPLAWSEIAGWAQDDHLAAYKAFRTSCKAINGQTGPALDSKALGISLRDPCRAARATEMTDSSRARAFF